MQKIPHFTPQKDEGGQIGIPMRSKLNLPNHIKNSYKILRDNTTENG